MITQSEDDISDKLGTRQKKKKERKSPGGEIIPRTCKPRWFLRIEVDTEVSTLSSFVVKILQHSEESSGVFDDRRGSRRLL